MIVSEITSPMEFYLQSPGSTELAQLENDLAKYDGKQTDPLDLPIKKNTLCLAKWQGGWYRAKIVAEKNKKGLYAVFFVDYGNYDEVSSASLRKCGKYWGKAKP